MAGLNPARVVASLYLLLLLLLALAIWDPKWSRASDAVDLLLVADESASVPAQYNDRLWASLLSLPLPAQSRIALLRFADRSAIEIPWTQRDDPRFANPLQALPRKAYLDTGASDIHGALDNALQLLSPERRSLVLLSSDGLDTMTDEAPSLAALSNAAIYYHRPEAADSPPRTRIASIDLPPVIEAGSALPISLAIEPGGADLSTIEIFHNRERVVSARRQLQPGSPGVFTFRIVIDRPGTHALEFQLRDAEDRVVDQRGRALQAIGGGKLLLVGRHPQTTAAITPPGWSSRFVTPEQLGSDESFFEPFDVVLIDDLDADAINEVILRNLQRSVCQSGTGLVVVGGPNSFGSGAYRHSLLESMLPVTAEASRLPASAFLFLIDKSGSMDSAGRNRLEDAVAAVRESAQSIRAGDETALLAFDREVQELLPLRRRADFAAELDRPWPIAASGGTLLAPALASASDSLARSESSSRFLIVATDGVVELEDIDGLQTRLERASIHLIVLATGDHGQFETLEQLATASGGRLLRVSDTAQLPTFMRDQLESTRHSWRNEATVPETRRPLPFVAATDWRALSGFQLTRAKTGSRVYLASAAGDPLFAFVYQGVGGVAALPGGLPQSSDGQALVPALLHWMSRQRLNSHLQISHRIANGRLQLVVDALDADNRWQTDAGAQLVLHGVGGSPLPAPLNLLAPGRYVAEMPVPVGGAYQAVVRIGDSVGRKALYLEQDGENRISAPAGWFLQAIEEGRLHTFSEEAFRHALSASSGSVSTRPGWLLLTLLVLLVLIAVEFHPSLGLKQLSKGAK